MAYRLVAVLLWVSSLALAGCSDAGDTPPAPTTDDGAPDAEVSIHGFAFDPKTLSVQVGDRVRFTNHDSAAHTATADDGSWDTGSLGGGDSDDVAFDQAGTISYKCRFHASMTGTVTVAA